ncbi:MAG: ATP-binding protein [Bacilli bacterium]|nr:ATP-binding protein [Bacilli bacterium]
MVEMKEMSFSNKSLTDLKKSYDEALQDKSFLNLVKRLELSSSDAMKITSKLQDTIRECQHCEHCSGLYMCKNAFKGHVRIPEKKMGSVIFSYAPCKYQKKFEKIVKEKEKKANLNMYARMKDIDVSGDKKRIDVIKWIDQYFDQYDFSETSKGLYLHGNFGCGKTFLISALFHELEIIKHATICIAYYPEILRELKDDWETFESKMKFYQKVDLLFLDDIGAERVTEWGRDEVLGTILQYRMEHKLPTFFSSNMSIKELENHLAGIGPMKDPIKARRIVERIKQLAIEKELISENRRN